MAYDIGSTIARGWGAGRAIGDDISDWRMRRGEGRIREKYEALAAQEGKPLEDYLPQIEQELQDLGSGMFGADRRGVTDADGRSLSSGALGRISELARVAAARKAGGMALSGDQAGARGALAASAYGRGEFDAGQSQQLAQQQIGATQGAMRADGTYDAAKGRQALAGVAAGYGDAGAAEANQQGATSFRLQAARAKADALFNMAQNPDKFSDDQFAGTWEGFKENVPELKNVDLRKGPDNVLYLYTNGQATGSFDPKNKTDVEELSTMMAQFTKAPGEALGSYMQQRLANVTAEREERSKLSGKVDDAIIDVIKQAKAQQIPEGVASKITAASTGTGESKGWQLQEMGEDPGQFLMQKGGKVYVIKTNVAADPKTGLGAAPVQVFEADGVTPVNASALNSGDKEGFEFTVGAVRDLMSLGNATQIEWMKGQISALNEFRNSRLGISGAPSAGGAAGAGGGRGPSRGDRNNNPGNIEDRGQFKGMPGYLGSDGRFARFENREQGMAAMHNQLQRYMEGKTTGQPLRSVSEVIPTWSPQSDPTNQAGSTANYVRYVAQRLGVDPNAPLTPDQIPALADAMVEFETGNTGGSKPAQAIATASERPAATPRAAAPAAPAAPAGGRRAAISRDQLQRDAAMGTEVAARTQQAAEALRRFVRENPPDLRRQALNVASGTAGMMGIGDELEDPGTQVYRDPAKQRVYDRLMQDVRRLTAEANTFAKDARGNTRAFQRDRRMAAEDEQVDDLYSRYGGTGNYGGASR